MRLSPAANRPHAGKEACRDLEAIRKLIAPLSPPVSAFEASIRSTPFRILISVLLSSRTKDPVTEKAAARLFAEASIPEKMARLSEQRVSHLIYPVGFYRTKAKNILNICSILEHSAKFPSTMEELLVLPGVGRKSANLVLALAFARPAIAVDTHVFRISRRLGWAAGRTPGDVEKELEQLFPRRRWTGINQVLVGFGQTICRPVRPLCSDCILKRTCPSSLTQQRENPHR